MGIRKSTQRITQVMLDVAESREQIATAALAKAIGERDVALTFTDTPSPCEMTHTPPFDFAQCETHDTTFPLGGACKWHGKDSISAVLQDEADEQRGRAVRAEIELDYALAERDRAIAERDASRQVNAEFLAAVADLAEHDRVLVTATAERAAALAENAFLVHEIGTPGEGPFTNGQRHADEARVQIAAKIRTVFNVPAPTAGE